MLLQTQIERFQSFPKLNILLLLNLVQIQKFLHSEAPEFR